MGPPDPEEVARDLAQLASDLTRTKGCREFIHSNSWKRFSEVRMHQVLRSSQPLVTTKQR